MIRLLHTETLELQEFFDEDVPRYAILSHTWVKNQEISFQEIQALTRELKRRSGFIKIRRCCARARKHGFDWVWIDTCCIDKTSSAELSEGMLQAFHV